MREFNLAKKNKAIVLSLTLVVILTILNNVFSIMFGGKVLSITGMPLNMNTLNGCIQTVTFMLGIEMIFMSPTIGLWVSLGAIFVSMVGAIRTMIVMHFLEPLPGLLNCLFFLVAAFIVSKQCRKNEKRVATDDVTGLLNTYEFEHRLFKKTYYKEKGHLLIINLDGFSRENAKLGREMGDKILHIIADRIKSVISEKSQAFKIESSDYAVIIPIDEDYMAVSESLIDAIEEPVSLNKDDIVTNTYLTAYVGVASFEDGTVSARDLVKHGDIALNYAKNLGQDKICVFNDKMRELMDRETEIERLIKEGLKNGYFYLVYQPQFTAADKRLRGFETLIRMSTPSGIQIPAGELISIAERSELILDIDRFVLRRAMTEFKEICSLPDNVLTLAVNVSAKEITRAGFADKLIDLIEEINFPAECLEIEITEYSFAESQSHTIDNIRKLRRHQVMVALDDFGSGYTSLEQLMKLPVNIVKLDKSLIDKVASSKINTDFIKSAIYMGHIMDTEVIAEGVEYEDQLEMLRTLNCDYIQGFLWGRPMDYLDAKELGMDGQY